MKNSSYEAYLADGALDVSNDGSVGIVDELDSDLSHVTGVTSAAENFVHLSKLDGLILRVILNEMNTNNGQPQGHTTHNARESSILTILNDKD